MRIRTLVALLLMAATTSGCAAIRYPLPTCDGSARRPLNAEHWTYDKQSDVGVAASRLACG